MSATHHLTDEEARRLETRYMTAGSILRRRIQRMLAGVVAVGPTERAATEHKPPTLAEAEAADQKAIADELRAITARIRAIDQFLALSAKSTNVWGSGADYETQELRSERQSLCALRAEIEDDQRNPITHARDGAPLDARWRAIRRERTLSLRRSYWEAAEAARAEGDHRRARRLRLDSLRARHLAEAEMNWRNLSTYL